MNDNTLLPKDAMNAVAQSLLQHWSSEHNRRLTEKTDVAKPAPQIAELLSEFLQNHFPAQTPRSQIDSFSTPVQRSDSLSSSASLSRSASLSSTASTICGGDDEEEDDDDEDDNIVRRRARAPAAEKAAVVVVTRPVLGLVDARFLALHPRVANELFKRRFKCQRNGDGTRSLKKHKDIVMPKFREITRNVIRRLCRRDLPTLQHDDNTLTYARLRRRYFRAALKVVKKRRANHIQGWRLNNTHKPLIYGNDLEHQQHIHHPGSPGPRPPSAPVQPAVSKYRIGQMNYIPRPKLPGPRPLTPVQPTVESDPRPPSAPVKPAASSLPVKRKLSEVDFSDDEPTEEFKCCEKNCAVVLTKDTAFPKDKQNLWGDNKFRCAQHWEEHVITMCEAVEDDRARDQALRTLTAKNKNTRKKKKNVRVGCKWCGATTHKTKRSRKCPYNPRNIESQEKPEQESQRQSEPEQESQRQSSEPEQEPQQQQLSAESETETEPEPVLPKPADDSETEEEPEPQPADDPQPVDDLPPLYGAGDNVLAVFKGRWYLAHVSKLIGNGLISVYFPADALTKNARPHEVQPYQGVQQPKRADMLNKTFNFEGDDELPPGVWKVRQLQNESNEYVCTKIQGSGRVNVDRFDIGYVMHRVREEEERIRQF